MPRKSGSMPANAQIATLIEHQNKILSELREDRVAERSFLLGELDRRLEPIATEVAVLRTCYRSLVEGQAKLEQSVTNLEVGQTEIKQELREIKRIVLRHEDRIDTLERESLAARR